MTAPFWTLYNNKTEQSVEGLTPDMAIAKMRLELDSELQFWFVWYEGLANWTPVLEHPEFASLKAPAPVFEEIPEVEATPVEPSFDYEETDGPTVIDAEAHLEKTQIDYDPKAQIQEIEQLVEAVEPERGFEATAEHHIGEATAEHHIDEVTAGPVVEVAHVEPAEEAEVTVTASKPLPVVNFDDEDPAIHIFWMAESTEQEPQKAHLGQMSAEYAASHPVSENTITGVRSYEAEHFEDAVQMPEEAVDIKPVASQKSGRERRQFERYDIRYRVIVRNENLTFRTFSKNISLGGLALEMPVPEAMLGSDCQIYVGNPKTGENIRFSGKLVPNRSEAKYFLFLQASAESLLKLQKWVEAHTTQKSA